MINIKKKIPVRKVIYTYTRTLAYLHTVNDVNREAVIIIHRRTALTKPDQVYSTVQTTLYRLQRKGSVITACVDKETRKFEVQ